MHIRLSSIILAALLSSISALAQAVPAQQTSPSAGTPARRPVRSGGSISGTIKDNTGGVIPGASVTLSNEGGTVRTVTTGADGSYVFRGIAPGAYTISATYTGLQQEGITAVTVVAGQAATRDISMTLQAQRQEVTVNETATNTVSTDPANNASALVLKPEDLDALPDDPDDLQADLEALAGPSAGPGGNQIYIDGFSGGRLPPKESIREIRINSNPFSAEYDRLGYGRIQIFTKPGSDKFHGQGYYNISDGIWNSRNPFLVQPGLSNPPFRTQLFGGNVSGPLSKHASFFIDTERRQIDDNGIFTSTIPTDDFLGQQAYQGYYSTPQRRTTVSPRVDLQLGSNNTLSFRYSFLENDLLLAGIGGFNLPGTTIGGLSFASTGYTTSDTEHTVQIVETSVLSPKAVNETHFIFEDSKSLQTSSSTTPSLNVGQSFVVGGSGYSAPGYPNTNTLEHYYELQNYTSIIWGAHTTKFGARIRATTLDDTSPKNFNGVYSFLGTNTISSIQEYLTTVQLLNAGRTPAQIAALGYGPSKYTANAGNPYIGLNQEDYGPFVQDDWKARPNLTLSMGLRWESQTNINDHSSWAPRFGFAWSPDQGKGANSRAKTVIRGGWGIFYDRFSISNVENAYRYLPGVGGYQTYTLNNPFQVLTSADP
ncbi:MAG: TonB-dependent receptor, partial [Acidobacteriaceae bacterium]|nr:TonB-dependent receptor [Acidobacteriaceae bacterium]